MHRGKVYPEVSELPRGNELSRDHVNRPLLSLNILRQFLGPTHVPFGPFLLEGILKTLGEQNTGKSLPIATVWLLLRHFTRIFGFSNENDLSNILWLVLNLLCVRRYYRS